MYALKSTVALAILLHCTCVRAQNVNVNVEPKIEELADKWQARNEAQTTVDGWRVQILATTDRARLEAVEADFKINYPSVSVDWVHAKPYYKLRAGAFLTKQEAERLKATLSRQFEGVYLVKDEVKESELVRL